MNIPADQFMPYLPVAENAAAVSIGSIDARLSRTNYYDGQLLKASDLTRDQTYLDERLLEMGQILGSGVVRGLQVKLVNNTMLSVEPGLALAPSGRVLQLRDRALEIDLQDRATIATLNDGQHNQIPRGLYAVVLRHAEVAEDVSEAYPGNLNTQQLHAAAYSEGVEVALLPLGLPLPSGDPLIARAALVRPLIGLGTLPELGSEEAVALGVLAIDQSRPAWIDSGLLRRMQDTQRQVHATQMNLAAHYKELLADIVVDRKSRGLNRGFAAAQYFQLLPPFGPIPKSSVNPVDGSQTFFPKEYEVSIAPVRWADVDNIVAESARLTPMDLAQEADADIMVLVPMSDSAFALRARQLEQPITSGDSTLTSLRAISALALRFRPIPPVHQLDTDAKVWQAIWDDLGDDQLLYVRRPPRAAETNVSAIVLATGFAQTPPTLLLPKNSADMENQLEKAQEDYAQAKEALTKQTDEIKQLNQQVAQLHDIVNNDVDLISAQARIGQLQAEITQMQAQLVTLQDQAKDAITFKAALATATEKITSLQSELQTTHARIGELESRLAVDEAGLAKLDELSGQLKATQQQIDALTVERNSLIDRLAASQADLTRANGTIDSLRQQVLDLQTAVADGGAGYIAQIADLQGQIANLQTQLGNVTSARDKALADLQAMTLLRDAVQASLDSAAAQVNALQAKLNDASVALANCNAARTAYTLLVTALQTNISYLTALTATFDLAPIARLRLASTSEFLAMATRLDEMTAKNALVRIAIIQLVSATPASCDKALWPSLVSVASAGLKFEKLRDQVFAILPKESRIAAIFAKIGPDFGMNATDQKNWESVL